MVTVFSHQVHVRVLEPFSGVNGDAVLVLNQQLALLCSTLVIVTALLLLFLRPVPTFLGWQGLHDVFQHLLITEAEVDVVHITLWLTSIPLGPTTLSQRLHHHYIINTMYNYTTHMYSIVKAVKSGTHESVS